MVCRSDSRQVTAFSVEPISPFVRRQFLNKLRKWTEDDRLAMLIRFSRIPSADGIVGVLFEAHHQYQFEFYIHIVANLMFRTSDKRSRWHAPFGDFSDTPQLEKARSEQAMKSSIPDLVISTLPANAMTYDGEGPLTVEEDTYYHVSFTSTGASIDSSIVHSGHLYLCRFTASSYHGVSHRLQDLLPRLSGLPPAENQRPMIVLIARARVSVSYLATLHMWQGWTTY